MQKKLLLFVVNMLLIMNSYAINKQDSIYHDLYQFLILKGDLPKEMDWLLQCDSCKCKQYLYIFDILKDDFPNKPDFINIPFGIYEFQYDGCMDCGFYVLIKHNESYTVYPKTSVTLIIKNLIKIRKENPDLIDNKLFETYIEAIIDDLRGKYPSERNVIVQKIGHIDFIVN